MKIDIKKVEIAMARKMFSYNGLAAAMGVTYRSLYHLLHESKNPRPATVSSLAKALDVNAADIIMSEDTPF